MRILGVMTLCFGVLMLTLGVHLFSYPVPSIMALGGICLLISIPTIAIPLAYL